MDLPALQPLTPDHGPVVRVRDERHIQSADPIPDCPVLSLHDGRLVHPIADTIDAAVLAMPEGWVWERILDNAFNGGTSWYMAWKVNHETKKLDSVCEELTGHTPEDIRRDLLALARLAWIAEGAEP